MQRPNLSKLVFSSLLSLYPQNWRSSRLDPPGSSLHGVVAPTEVQGKVLGRISSSLITWEQEPVEEKGR